MSESLDEMTEELRRLSAALQVSGAYRSMQLAARIARLRRRIARQDAARAHCLGLSSGKDSQRKAGPAATGPRPMARFHSVGRRTSRGNLGEGRQ